MLDINLPDEHRARSEHRGRRDWQGEREELARGDADALLAEDRAPEEARERRGERERERAEVGAERERVHRAVPRARVDVRAGRGPELEHAREEDRRADVRPAQLRAGGERSG